VVLAKDGKPAVPIVCPTHPAKGSHQPDFAAAAADLRDLIRKASGAVPEMIPPEQWNKSGAGGSAIFFETDPGLPGEEAFHVETRSDGLHFAVSAKGDAELQAETIQHAVNQFAKKALGCRWLMPGELGEVIPHRDTIKLTDFTLAENPVFWSRRIRDRQAAGHDDRRQRSFDALEKGGAAVDMKTAESGMGAGAWLNRMNMGTRFPFQFGHSFAGFWDEHGPAHPEYFALQPDGTRTQHPPRERLCESQPALWDEVAARALKAFGDDPELHMFSICENDGGAGSFCMCPKCMALDPPNAPKVYSPKIYDPATGEPFSDGYPSLSDRMFTFFNEVGRRVKAKYPDRLLGVYAYSVYRTVPVNVKKLEDNLVVSVVSDDAEEVKKWAQFAQKIFVRPNTFWDGRCFGMARNDARQLGALMQTCGRNHVLGLDFDGMIGNWATQGLSYYVVAELMWNPEQDVEALIDDYLRSAYGKAAAPAMKQYYDRVEAVSSAALGDPAYSGRKPSPEPLLKHYTPAVMAELGRALTEALQIAPADSPERRRIELVQQGLEYTRHVCGLIEGVSKSDQRNAYEAEWKKHAPYFAQIASSPYFGTAQNITHLTPALRGIERRGRKGAE
jgi:hypothetical protein